jgi:hypothetical protein
MNSDSCLFICSSFYLARSSTGDLHLLRHRGPEVESLPGPRAPGLPKLEPRDLQRFCFAVLAEQQFCRPGRAHAAPHRGFIAERGRALSPAANAFMDVAREVESGMPQ